MTLGFVKSGGLDSSAGRNEGPKPKALSPDLEASVCLAVTVQGRALVSRTLRTLALKACGRVGNEYGTASTYTFSGQPTTRN